MAKRSVGPRGWQVSAKQRCAWALLAVAPLLVLFLLVQGVLNDPVLMGADFHFLVVTMTSFIALIMAVLMVVAAGQIRDARVVYLALGFLGIAGIFSVHGLSTPGAIIAGLNPWIGFAARFAMLTGAAFFALSTLGRGSRFERAILARQ